VLRILCKDGRQYAPLSFSVFYINKQFNLIQCQARELIVREYNFCVVVGIRVFFARKLQTWGHVLSVDFQDWQYQSSHPC